ncbi:acyl-coenzyme A diphosphatase NUDT19 [Hyla sarda]|uniref:acyl-coenzyme A diphosphatase NUDT19 n=1 Tax=Hyla sarda TaxID=327740 RepID=UPI0024C267EE|nr:acyl-coenzyme A diphosphatase NUDT19 [Hyla sarda]XP_056381708.1 acyl-coenzyme A diphosphatase NUDT19 [Hyla sarda]XP_056381709.1 acyl-coenzyme A diphosphatase NUDT19 [Hyla sarda]
MNNTLKHWREAATLILAAGCQHLSAMPKITTQGPCDSHQKNTAFDYKVLLLQRSKKSGFMPNAYVFPGGLVEPSDFSNDWVKVFERYVDKPNFGLGIVKQPPDTRPPMFLTDRTKFGSLIPNEVAFRICAIRETFEESGILLVVPENSDIEDNQKLKAAYEENGETVAKWREEVQNDPLRFIEMCKELQCVPNIWALHEWGNWLTPVFSNNSRARRYDTAFFICCLPRKPVTSNDQKEVTSFIWLTPQEAIEGHRNKTWVPPPQFVEFSRLCNFTHFQELQEFTLHRALEGCERWFSVVVHARDGMIHILPGDDLYPDDPDVTGQTEKTYSTNKTIEELVRDKKNINRFLLVDGVPQCLVTIQPKYKHIKPVMLQLHSGTEPKSQL